ncbi:hypothetical protein [African swine fever virus]|uniref:Uncharacterized protein n=1 Tax=African swine fever virus TaxID=10497 RepID=A0A3G1EV53_ASF|nr:hypothetical protein F8221_gp151 [African swine fever virus]AOO54456.1 hypothetical protein AFSV47Ss_0151 [African swine fever virus]QID21280.1 hypothetical protein AFSV47Ss_0151 [African swine fever virus]QIM06792.1 hypothetical protein [African swine fever virus]QIM07027.1 hypothetical protein [African swine fever virus]QIM07262.1 hypothetical protein [African swine fever virus]
MTIRGKALWRLPFLIYLRAPFPPRGVSMMREWEPPITIINASLAHTSASNVWDTLGYCRCMLRCFSRSSSPKYDDG